MMIGRTRISIPKTTWAYVAILAVAVLGAIMREINLLIILAGMMCGPLLISWQMIHINLRKLTIRRKIPTSVFSGSPFDVEFSIHNQRRSVDSWALVLEDRIRNQTNQAIKMGKARCFVPRVGAKQLATARYRVRLLTRGRYRFGPLRISTGVPFGLLQGKIRTRTYDDVLVFPRLGTLRRGWKRSVQYDHQGQHQNHQRKGRIEGNFYGLRDWQSGDSHRWIHWRSSAKRNELLVRQFEENRSHNLVLLVDLTHPAATPVDPKHLELVTSFVATAVTDYCRRSAGQITVRVAGSPAVEIHGPSGRAILNDILEVLAEVSSAADLVPHETFGALPHLKSTDHLVIAGTRSIKFDRWTPSFDPHDNERAKLQSAIVFDVSDPNIDDVFTIEPTPSDISELELAE